MIPKIIHYCWFGNNPKSKKVLKCMRSWEKHCMGYQLTEWNEDTFDLSSAPVYVQQAYAYQKWAFVTDYVRLFALYNYGGIYMDTDVEVKKSLDYFLNLQGFGGFEDEQTASTCLLAAEKGHPLIREWLYEYYDKKFILPDGTLNEEANVAPVTRSLVKHGLRLDNTLQTVADFTIYPKDYFSAKSLHDGLVYRTRNTHTIHHFAGSWLPEYKKKQLRRKQSFQKAIYVPKKLLKIVLGKDKFTRLKEYLRRN